MVRSMTDYVDWEMANSKSGVNDQPNVCILYHLDGVSVWTQIHGGTVHSVKPHGGYHDRAPTEEELWSCLATTIAMYRCSYGGNIRSIPNTVPRGGY